MTPAQKSALKWLRARGHTGVFDKNNVLLAQGERAPVMRSTWNALRSAGMVMCPSKGRLTVTPAGANVDLHGVDESPDDNLINGND